MFHGSPSRLRARRSSLPILFSALFCLAMPALVAATTSTPVIMPLDEVKAGMKGVGYTIFSGDKVEPFNLVVLGILPDLLGPKQSIILVQLVGPQVEHTGVVAGMSGSPVYIDGKLIGALSLKLGQFTKDPIAGITPIENMLEISASDRGPAGGEGGHSQFPANTSIPLQYPVPPESFPGFHFPRGPGGNGVASGSAFLTPIASPMAISGASPAAVAMFSGAFAEFGMVATSGGSGTPRADDADLKPGDMVSMPRMRGDMWVAPSCTVTAVINNHVYACGHTITSFGAVDMPMSRSRVITTLSSDMDSTKITTTGGVIGTFTDDRLTAI